MEFLSGGDVSAGQQVDYQYNQRNYQQQVNQASRYMQAETQQPQDQ
jgi:hypothetical protein